MQLRKILSVNGVPRASRRLIGIPIGLGLLSLLGAHAARHVQSTNGRVASLEWLAGCWVEDLGPIKVIDEWAEPMGHTMLGVSRTRRGDSTIALELRRLTDTTGALVLATLSANGRSNLRLDRMDASSAEFSESMSGRRIIVRFDREGSHELELGTERRIGARQRTMNELFERASCGDGQPLHG